METLIRVPLIMGLPEQTSGSMSMSPIMLTIFQLARFLTSHKGLNVDMRMIVPEARRIVAMVALMALLLAPEGSWAQGMTVRINEVMASNGSTIADEDGDYADWIEL